LSKRYGSLTAVDHISFAIEEGICFGLLGPNGAGKTTTIEMMEGILAPAEGSILFRDQPIGANFHERVGIQFQHTALQEFITVEETLKLFSALYQKHRDLEEVIEICSLRDILKQDNRKLSGGQRQRLLLALVNDPELVFLDEPTTGLDPQARRNFWSLIEKIRAEGKTIILTTHYMDEAQALCDDIAIMDQGHIIARNSPDKLLSAHFEGVLVRLPWEESQPLPFPDNVRRINNHIEIHSRDVDRTLHELIHAGVHLEGLSIHTPDLEDLFLKLTGSSLRS